MNWHYRLVRFSWRQIENLSCWKLHEKCGNRKCVSCVIIANKYIIGLRASNFLCFTLNVEFGSSFCCSFYFHVKETHIRRKVMENNFKTIEMVQQLQLGRLCFRYVHQISILLHHFDETLPICPALVTIIWKLLDGRTHVITFKHNMINIPALRHAEITRAANNPNLFQHQWN